MIYTSYFDNIKNLPKSMILISICGEVPDWYHGFQYKKLAPKRKFFDEWKINNDNGYYIRCFNEQVLSRLKAIDVIMDFSTIFYNFNAGGNDICLLCYEKPEEFCHRHLVAEWFRNNGFHCVEWENI